MKIIDLQKGLTFHRTAKDSVFYKNLKKILDYSSIPYADPCCLSDNDGTRQPVAYNSVTDSLIRFNTDTGDWSSFALTVGADGIASGNMVAGFFPTVAAQNLSGAGAVNVTSYLTKFTSTGAAQALTIASGTVIGQRKKIVHVVDGGSGVLTGVFVGGTTITFTTVGEFADLIWEGTSWAVLELGNTATPATIPVLA